MLLGYQLLGSGQVDKTLTPLGEAAKDPSNSEPVRILLNLREKVLEDQKTTAGTVASPVGSSAAPAAQGQAPAQATTPSAVTGTGVTIQPVQPATPAAKTPTDSTAKKEE